MSLTSPQLTHMSMIKGALSLELKGLKRRGESAYAQAKRLYKLTGNKQTVYEKLCELYRLNVTLYIMEKNYWEAYENQDTATLTTLEADIASLQDHIEEITV